MLDGCQHLRLIDKRRSKVVVDAAFRVSYIHGVHNLGSRMMVLFAFAFVLCVDAIDQLDFL
jgi:hypothetical protein